MATLKTVFTGTILATGRTLTHGLGTTPDYCLAIDETGTGGTFGMAPSVLTFGSQTVTVAGRVDGASVRVVAEKMHSIVIGP
jgi:hypothetical protein